MHSQRCGWVWGVVGAAAAYLVGCPAVSPRPAPPVSPRPQASPSPSPSPSPLEIPPATPLEEGRRALERGEVAEAIDALERARLLDPAQVEVCYLLARAYEHHGQVEDALAFYAETARLDSDGRGPIAQRDARRLRDRWLAVELEDADQAYGAGRYGTAAKAYEQAYVVAGPQQSEARSHAREGYARAGAAQLASEAMAGRAGSSGVVLYPFSGVPPGSGLLPVVDLLEVALREAFLKKGARLLPHSEADQAELMVHGFAGQRLVLTVREPGGQALASLALRALVDPHKVRALRPDPLELDLSAETPPQGGSGPWIQITEGSALRSGDGFRVRARISREAYLYVFNVDAGNNTTLLYPYTERFFPALQEAGVRASNPVGGGQDVLIPPPAPERPTFYFFLDEVTGREILWVVASLEPLAEIEVFLPRLREGGRLGPQERARVDAILEDLAGASRVSDLGQSQLVRGRGALARHVSFEHRQ